MTTSKNASADYPRGVLNLLRGLVLLVLVLFFAGALAVPFYFETQTLWYKVGIDKTMLRGGQIAGMLAIVFLFLQITLSLRSKLLETLFGSATLLRWHRINGVIIGVLAVAHVLLVLLPEGLENLPIGKKYWPEMVGMLLFMVLLPMVLLSHFRQKLKLDYKKWRTLHKPMGYLIIILVTIHVLFVSESFEHDSLKATLLIVFTGLVVQVVVVKRLLYRITGKKQDR